MKIAICLYPLMDLGGIINHTEQLVGGFQDLGHEVSILELSWKDKHPRAQNKYMDDSWEIGPSNIPFHQGKGWNFPAKSRFGYKNSWRRKETINHLNKYDLVIWSVPVPTKLAEHRGNADWPELYEKCTAKQIAIIHDGNALDGCPHILRIAEYLDGVAAVHPCAYRGSSFIPTRRKMILNPQDLSYDDYYSWNAWHRRLNGFISCQTFKAWKHVHELIEAIAYMPPLKNREIRLVAGQGIEYRYMVSEDKCKPQYFHKEYIKTDFAGERFWDAAERNGMYRPPLGYLTSKEVSMYLYTTKTLIDPSWSNKYSKVGGHPNRVVVDAIRCGAVPVARPKGMGDEIFQAGVHYYAIPDGVTPEDYAKHVIEAGFMGKTDANKYREAGRDKLQLFERSKIARQYLALAFEEDGEVGVETDEACRKSDDILLNFFQIGSF